VAAAVQLERPFPSPTLRTALGASYTISGRVDTLPWPGVGQAALYLSGFGWLGASADQTSVPIASVAKVMTALVILRAHPLQLGEAGPAITVSAADLALYQAELGAGDSVVAVQSGETLSELQLLEGLLLPSGDNLAVVLADWDASSEPRFVSVMNQAAAGLKLQQTRFADSSGLDPASVSSARDLVTLATAAMSNPVFASIVSMPSAVLPVAGMVRNYDYLLGQDGVVGIKTGWTSASLGCLVFAADQQVGGQAVQLIGAVLGQPGGPTSGLRAAGAVALGLIASAQNELRLVDLPKAGEPVGELVTSWGTRTPIQSVGRIQIVGPGGARIALRLRLRRLRLPLGRGRPVGTLAAISPAGVDHSLGVVTQGALSGPSWWWRLTRF
jgi:D-alanyl-D-alanine carboxypeptidase (penicillin-binding protein 5/6)